MVDKKSLYEEHHTSLTDMVMKMSEFLLTYAESRYREEALKKLEEAYLWGTQMIHSLVQTAVENHEKEKEEKPPVDLSIN